MRIDRFPALLMSLVVCATLVVACRRAPATPTPGRSRPSPSPPPARATLTPEPSPLPDRAEALRRSQARLLSWPGVGLEAEYTSFLWPGAPPLTDTRHGCLLLGGEEDAAGGRARLEIVLPAGISQRDVCRGTGADARCYTQVAEQPWFRNVWLEQQRTWPGERGAVLAAATVAGSSASATGDGSVRINWSRADWPTPGILLEGESRLAADSFELQRETLHFFDDGVLVGRSTATYAPCEPDPPAEPWPPPTVTPAPTVAPPAADLEIREEAPPFPGILYRPAGEGPFPAVIVLHGSEGTVAGTDGLAQRLARNGLVALAYCYFGCLETPWTMEKIEIARVSEAMAYLRDRPDTVGERVGLLGVSRGAELALLMGVLDETAGPVVAMMTAPWVFGSPDSPTPAPAWIYQGDPLPFVVIPVEEIAGPVLLLHGQQDSVWPVSFAYIVAERLAAHDRAYELVVYPHRGHNLGSPRHDALNQAVHFLRAHLLP